jgi:hypothetical protein
MDPSSGRRNNVCFLAPRSLNSHYTLTRSLAAVLITLALAVCLAVFNQ